MFETNFSEHNKIWRAQKILGGIALEYPPRGYGPGAVDRVLYVENK